MIIRLFAASLLALCVFVLPANAETVRWARSGDATTLDPHAGADAMSMQLNRNIYEPLVERDADGQLAPKLATSWLAKADASVWTFNLRTYAQFHDGTDFAADDVVFSFTRAKGANSALASKLSNIVSVTAVDPSTVEIRFASPTSVLPASLSDVLIMDKEWATAHDIVAAKKPGVGNESFSMRHANGTGPYKLESRDPDVRTTLIANENYPGGGVADVDRIIYLPIVNPAMLARALQWGEVDVLQDVPPSDIEKLSATDGLKVETAAANDVLYLGFGFGAKFGASEDGSSKNPFDNPRVRRAIDLALDRENIAAFVDRGHAKPTNMLAAPFVDGWTEARAAARKPDREMAEALFSDAKYPDGFAVKFDVARSDAAAANRIASMLAGAGIWANVVTRTHEAHLAYVKSGKSQMYLADYAAPGYDSAAIVDWLANDHAGYENVGLSAKISALSGISGTERGSVISEIWDTIQNEHIALPIAQRMLAHAMRDGITVSVDPHNQTRFETIQVDE